MPSRRLWLIALALMTSPATAQTTPAGGPAPTAANATSQSTLEQRAGQLAGLVAGRIAATDYFSAEFLSAIPQAQLDQIFSSLRSAHGEPLRLARLEAEPGARNGTALVDFERAQVRFLVAVDAAGKVQGLRITGADRVGDSLAALTADLAALPGMTGWGLYRLDGATPQRIAGAGHDQPLAIGSAFKLAILGALDAEIRAGRMRWADVISINRRSIPSGMVQRWPAGAPITLHTLATLMISISDNTATDILLHHLGRDRVEAFARAHGGLSGPNAFPILSTLEATILKDPAIGPAREQWLAGDEAARRRLLADQATLFTPERANPAIFEGRIADIDRIEWFASADSLAQLMAWFARDASEDARAILAVNPGIPPANAGRWAYVGYKGGSEPGVIAMSLLLRNAAGQPFAAVFSWNNSAAPVDDARFVALVSRAADLLSRP